MALNRTSHETELRFNEGNIQSVSIGYTLASTDGISVGQRFEWDGDELPMGLKTAIEALFNQLISRLDTDHPLV